MEESEKIEMEKKKTKLANNKNRVAPDQLPHALPAQGAARAVQENRAAFGTEEGPPVPDIIQQQGDGRVVYGDEPLLTAFAQNAQQPRLRVEIGQVEPRQFRHAQAAGSSKIFSILS